MLSIITTYQSEQFRRVKIGIDKPPDKSLAASFVLSSFSAAEEVPMAEAVTEASSRVLRLIAQSGPDSVTAQ